MGHTQNKLSRFVCWSRMQAEAGQRIEAIIMRKELERLSGGGLFCWGIGNAPPKALSKLARASEPIDVLFSLMKSKPKAVDLAPAAITVWRSYFDLEGNEITLPPNVLVTSGAKASRRSHYALVCRADRLQLGDYGSFNHHAYRNVSELGRPVGASQVTALVQRNAKPLDEMKSSYRVNLRAKLSEGGWVRLGSPTQLSRTRRAELVEAFELVHELSPADWLKLTARMRSDRPRVRRKRGEQLQLFDH